MQDDAVMRLLKMILKATEERGSTRRCDFTLLSNLYLNEVDRMLGKRSTPHATGNTPTSNMYDLRMTW